MHSHLWYILELAELQVARSPYKNVWDCYTRIMRDEGPRAFFKSYKTTVSFPALQQQLDSADLSASYLCTYRVACTGITRQDNAGYLS